VTGKIEARLADLGLVLPASPAPAGNYGPFALHDRLVQLAGVAPVENGRYAFVGKVGREVDLATAQRAARLCALNLIANLRAACAGDLDRVSGFLMLRGYVNAAEDFESIPQVTNGASDLIVEVFGEKIGRHARTSIGCSVLPSRVSVEFDALVIID
jgi:enamine deaminase RidA (YjgF/YER057c/UK114 family)